MNFIRLGNSELAVETVYDILGLFPGDNQAYTENLHLLIYQIGAVILRVLLEDSYEGEKIDYSEFTTGLDNLLTHRYTTSYIDSLEKLIITACRIEENRTNERKLEIDEKSE